MRVYGGVNGLPSVISGAPTSRRDLDACILDQVQLRAFDRSLCLECGDGWVVEEAWRRTRRGYACGVDRSETLIARANASRAVPGGIEFKAWDGRQLPYPEGSFHVVLALSAPASHPELVNLLAEMQRVLQRGGEMHFVDANGALDNGDQPIGSELIDTLTWAGFQEASIEYRDSSSPAGRQGATTLVRAWRKTLAK